MTEHYQFPQCLHPVAGALHMMGCDPGGMVIELPFETWWKVRCELERRYSSFAQPFDGRGDLHDVFECMGIKFRRRPGT